MRSHSWCFISVFPDCLHCWWLHWTTHCLEQWFIGTVVKVCDVWCWFPLLVFAHISLTGWLGGEPWWPGSGVFSVLRHIAQWRVWKDGRATETQSSARHRNGKDPPLSAFISLCLSEGDSYLPQYLWSALITVRLALAVELDSYFQSLHWNKQISRFLQVHTLEIRYES